MLNTERRLTPSWELVSPSFKLVRENYEAVIIIALLPALLAQYAALVGARNQGLGYSLLLAAALWQLINTPIAYYLQFKVVKNQKIDTVGCYRQGFHFWPKIILFEILFAIMTIAGLMLLIIPGLIIIRRYYLTPYYIINNKKLSILAAMKKSANETRPVSGYVWGVLGVIIVYGLAASLLSRIPLVGPILATLVTVIILFIPALRWQEVSPAAGKK